MSTPIEQNTLDLRALIHKVNNLPDASGEGGGKEPTLQEKTISPSTSEQTVTPDIGFDGLSKVTVNAMTAVTQATPSITVDTSGLITASATQAEGYVSAGTESATKQLATQSAKTITPTKSSQMAIASGIYTTGTVTVAAIPSQYITTTDATAVAEDIRSGETAYVDGSKVTGTIEDFDGSYTCSSESTGGETNIETCMVVFDSTNSKYTNIIFLQYVTLDANGNVKSEIIRNQDITSSFSIQCICNTGVSGVFPPTESAQQIETTGASKLAVVATSVGTFGWYELTVLPNENATFTFN